MLSHCGYENSWARDERDGRKGKTRARLSSTLRSSRSFFSSKYTGNDKTRLFARKTEEVVNEVAGARECLTGEEREREREDTTMLQRSKI